MKIIRKDGNGIEITPPHVATEQAMAIAIAEKNKVYRQIAAEEKRRCAPVYATDYPVSGGWGYSQSNACVIKMKGKMDDKSLLLSERDGYAIENLFIERRIYEEIIIHPEPDAPELHCLRWKVGKQRLHRVGELLFDEISVTVSGFQEQDLEELEKDWNVHKGYVNDEVGLLKHQALAMSCRVLYNTTYWFDVTSFV